MLRTRRSLDVYLRTIGVQPPEEDIKVRDPDVKANLQRSFRRWAGREHPDKIIVQTERDARLKAEKLERFKEISAINDALQEGQFPDSIGLRQNGDAAEPSSRNRPRAATPSQSDEVFAKYQADFDASRHFASAVGRVKMGWSVQVVAETYGLTDPESLRQLSEVAGIRNVLLGWSVDDVMARHGMVNMDSRDELEKTFIHSDMAIQEILGGAPIQTIATTHGVKNPKHIDELKKIGEEALLAEARNAESNPREYVPGGAAGSARVEYSRTYGVGAASIRLGEDVQAVIQRLKIVGPENIAYLTKKAAERLVEHGANVKTAAQQFGIVDRGTLMQLEATATFGPALQAVRSGKDVQSVVRQLGIVGAENISFLTKNFQV